MTISFSDLPYIPVERIADHSSTLDCMSMACVSHTLWNKTAPTIRKRASCLGYPTEWSSAVKAFNFLRQLHKDMIDFANFAHRVSDVSGTMSKNERFVVSWILNLSSSEVVGAKNVVVSYQPRPFEDSSLKQLMRRVGVSKHPTFEYEEKIRITTVDFDAVVRDLSTFTAAQWGGIYSSSHESFSPTFGIKILNEERGTNRVYPAFSIVLAHKPPVNAKRKPMRCDSLFKNNDQTAIRAMLNLGYRLGHTKQFIEPGDLDETLSCNRFYLDHAIYSPKHGCDISYQGYLALMGDVAMMRIILENVGVVDVLRRVNSPLGLACIIKEPNLEMIELLLQHGANPTQLFHSKDQNGTLECDLVDHVVRKGKTHVLLLFIKYGLKTYARFQILDYIVACGTPDMLRQALEIDFKSPEMIKRVNIENPFEKGYQDVYTALEYARMMGKRKMVAVCEEYIREKGTRMSEFVSR